MSNTWNRVIEQYVSARVTASNANGYNTVVIENTISGSATIADGELWYLQWNILTGDVRLYRDNDLAFSHVFGEIYIAEDEEYYTRFQAGPGHSVRCEASIDDLRAYYAVQ